MKIILVHCATLILVHIPGFFSLSVQSCPLPPPCECDREDPIVYCRDKNLTSIPNVTKADGLWAFYLGANKITRIPSRSFVGVTLQMLILDSNEINSIDDDAFAGSEDSLLVLHLHYNRLKELPTAVGSLRKIMGINLQGNPMADFRDEVLQKVASSLQFISMGSDAMPKWPDSMKYLPNLISIDLYDVTFPTIPDNAFQLYRKNMSFLSFYNTSLITLPSFNGLDSLGDLLFQGNKNISANAISNSAKSGLPNLMHVIFEDNNLETIPNIFMKSPKLGALTVSSEPIAYIRDDVFPPNVFSNFMYLFFNNTKLTRVPSCVSSLASIVRLQITNSKITEIADSDFGGMTKLASLYLSGNPITQVSKDAFMTINQLTDVRLDNTNLTTIPTAIMNIKALQDVDLSDSPVRCSCGGLGWIKHWKIKPENLEVFGDCVNIKTSLMTYINKEVAKCPN
ncbi:leucine-rich repeat-containing G-protein coupled receptor 4-like [Saccostrea echinata]|uniref:leucine-rich repeat-containing G-protein coupled receptor 4-like n=1 Tax=Saccostrea echinata TaxID=191078 RepID=UPI002A80D0B7|nr:leucine-rich repeat-containing G-protein coupled receptor 4-like [Saccostrea echinata]